ncbi:MAG: M14 family metallopeptidase [Lewinellaceae bacterium]|nr:M14 family metallopeptidase [Lewinellaceae bacterium]MCB9290903.1 M14 family metallopeptidase [Lewinellaceae bacterium]
MKHLFSLILWAGFLLPPLLVSAQLETLSVPFERDSNTTATYGEAIHFYETLAARYPQLRLEEHGSTDVGFPLHLAILSTDGSFTPAAARAGGKQVLFINNAIHPGEPCGVDATMLLFRSLLQDASWRPFLDRLVILAIPFYNIGGGLNRGSYSRANQNGPRAYGFRGNARNLDLNRDFIKCDSRNAQTFNRLFASWQPDVLIDTHSSDGADYQYTMTLVPPQCDKLDPSLATYLDEELMPRLYAGMKEAGWEMTPYVYARDTPDKGIAGFLDLPRYSSGYAALHNTIGFMTEAHMWKPYKDRVRGTYTFIATMIKAMNEQRNALEQAREKAGRHVINQDSFALDWALDFSRSDTILFKGYEAGHKKSEVSGLDRMYYDRSRPYEKEIPYFRYYQPTASARRPFAYIIPQAYTGVAERLRWNGVAVHQLAEDTELEPEFSYIEEYETRERPYEGHYPHYNVKTREVHRRHLFRKGDYVAFTSQPANRYIVETLEPRAADSFFAWNFFDGILMQKEYFDSYIFEDTAAALLRNDPALQDALEKKRQEDEQFAQSARAQLDFIYRRTPYYEPTHNLYPVARLWEEVSLPLKN